MTDPKKPKKPCPRCSKPLSAQYRPFCSARCKQLDLGKWLNDSYVIPGEETISDSDENGE
ncbi:MAG: DNA gyrase inhibitor YacG [Sneathiella sp.]|nr:MAG: DNA gyrase inhibitor YacG [Sneathiella sp.]